MWQEIEDRQSFLLLNKVTMADESRQAVSKSVSKSASVTDTKFSSVQFSSVQDVIHALGKVHTRSTPSLGSFPNVADETLPMFV